MDDARLRRESKEMLRSLGPMSPMELARHLGGASGPGGDTSETVDPEGLLTALLDDAVEGEEFLAFPLADGRLCDLDEVLEGLTLTHVLDDEEQRERTLTLDVDLAALALLSPDGRSYPLTTGEVITHAEPGRRTLTGPPGWLPEAPVLVARVVDGGIELTGREEVPPVDESVVDRLDRALAAVRLRHEAVDEVELLIEARARFPRLLGSPEAPLAELFAAAGIRHSAGDGLLREDEPDLEDDLDDDLDDLIEHLHEDHDLDTAEIALILGVLADVGQVTNHVLVASIARIRSEATDALGPEAPDVDEFSRDELARLTLDALEAVDLDAAAEGLGEVLADIAMTAATVEDVVGSDPLAAACLLALLEASRPTLSGGHARANDAWLRARLLELVADDHADAERQLRRAHELDDEHVYAALDLVTYLADRGQAGAALGLLRRIDAPQVDDLGRLLSRFAAPGPTSARRNEPCPCGSGRKHKVCCQTSNGWPLQERTEWLWEKVKTFVASAVAVDLVAPIAEIVGDEPGPAAVVGDVGVANIAMFEGGLLEEMIKRRGWLLPADELELLHSWARVRAGAYELVGTEADDRLTLLDLSTGVRASFVDHAMASAVRSDRLTLGTAMLAWLIPEPTGVALSMGVVLVPDERRDDLLELLEARPTARQLAAWYRSLDASPDLATTAGDPMVLTTQVFAVPDVATARAALADHLEDAGDALIAHEEQGAQRWLKGTVVFGEESLTVSASSALRAAWFADLIAEVVPDAELVDVERLPVGDLAIGPDVDPGGGVHVPIELDELDPEIRRGLLGP